MLSTRDRGRSELTDTLLDGERISCYVIGGEARLCLPQILNTVLSSISLQSIHQACDELQIFCSTCTTDQLETLKRLEILPLSANQCGLITKSDAERLCSTLLEQNPPKASSSGFNAAKSVFSFKVEHQCFGRCEGILLPEAYTHPSARCIECLQCEGLFSPQKFICHSHSNTENRTCHWGFESANWRSYLHFSESYSDADKAKLEKRFGDFKSKFAGSNAPAHIGTMSRQAEAAVLIGQKRKTVRQKNCFFFTFWSVCSLRKNILDPITRKLFIR